MQMALGPALVYMTLKASHCSLCNEVPYGPPAPSQASADVHQKYLPCSYIGAFLESACRDTADAGRVGRSPDQRHL